MFELWLILFVLACLVCGAIGLVVERIQRREVIEYLRRERARHDWQARVVKTQCFWKE